MSAIMAAYTLHVPGCLFVFVWKRLCMAAEVPLFVTYVRGAVGTPGILRLVFAGLCVPAGRQRPSARRHVVLSAAGMRACALRMS